MIEKINIMLTKNKSMHISQIDNLTIPRDRQY